MCAGARRPLRDKVHGSGAARTKYSACMNATERTFFVLLNCRQAEEGVRTDAPMMMTTVGPNKGWWRMRSRGQWWRGIVTLAVTWVCMYVCKHAQRGNAGEHVTMSRRRHPDVSLSSRLVSSRDGRTGAGKTFCLDDSGSRG